MSKRTLDGFFKSPNKKTKIEHTTATLSSSNPLDDTGSKILNHESQQKQPLNTSDFTYTAHSTYAFPIANLPVSISQAIEDLITTSNGKVINNQPHLDLLYFQPLIPQSIATELFQHLRSTLPFYRVKYKITRFGKSVDINTPRFTTVFGLDETSRFTTTSIPTSDPKTIRMGTRIVETSDQSKPVPSTRYKCTPRPIPPALSLLLNVTEALTGDTFNFCLVNYYATGSDSISYHSDDERFLGLNPSIASFTLGAKRDFLMKHKPPEKGQAEVEAAPLKLSLGSGDMVLMRGETQSNWLHSIPKRKGGEADKGRINITLRRAMVPAGTENYYRYNVGEGEVYRWDERKREMMPVDRPGEKANMSVNGVVS